MVAQLPLRSSMGVVGGEESGELCRQWRQGVLVQGSLIVMTS